MSTVKVLGLTQAQFQENVQKALENHSGAPIKKITLLQRQ